MGRRKGEKILGKLSVSSAGYGFLSVDGFERDFFVPQPFIGKAMDKDIVQAELLPDRKTDGKIAKIIRVLERGRNTICGVLLAGGRIRPFSKKIPFEVCLKGSPGEARKGDWIEVELEEEKHHNASLVRVIGRAGDIQADISAIVSEYGLSAPYSQNDEDEAAKLKPVAVPRESFDGRCICTIDPVDAKDYDDAISVELLSDGDYELGVHIADVASWIPRGGSFDSDAFERAFTSYLPGRTLPMLPKNLTKKISLSPGKKSLAHSIVIKVCGKTGKVISSRRFRSEITVTARLSFDDVEFFIENGQLPGSFVGIKEFTFLSESLFRAVELYRKMRTLRSKEEEFLVLETEFVRAVCDENGGSVKLLKREVQREAEKLVEEFMLAANVEAAKEILAKGIPGLFRIHPAPFPEKSVEFCDFVRNVCGFSPGDISSRKGCNNFLKNIPDDHRKPVLTEAFLRAMARASYSEKNALHFGLGKSQYSHFTSPIRRYPDLVVHQQLLAYDGHSEARSKKQIAAIAVHCSEKEAINDEAFWAANDRLKLHFLKDKILNRDDLFFEAVISKVNSFGLILSIPEIGARGEIPHELLSGSERPRKRGSGRIEKGSKIYKCGDFIAVRLSNVDLTKGRAIFQPA